MLFRHRDSFEIAIDDAGVDVWMPTIGLTGLLGEQ